MSGYHQELLDAARQLLARAPQQRGRLPNARIRRCVSTCYYALIHFLAEDASNRLVGNKSALRRRRRILFRVFTHIGIKSTLQKVRGAAIDKSVADFLRLTGSGGGAIPPPAFAREMASAFIDAQAKRNEADYDLNAVLSETDARLLKTKVETAINHWQQARTEADHEFKNALSVLLLLKGQLRKDE